MADINHTISHGIGSPAGIPEFLTLGLQIGADIPPYTLTDEVVIRITATNDVAIRQTASGSVSVRSTTSGDSEL